MRFAERHLLSTAGDLDADHVICSRHHQDFSVAHTTCAGHFDNRPHNLIHPGVVHPQRDFHLGKERQGVLTLAILVEITLLPPKAFDFLDVERLNRRVPQIGEHLFGKERLDDRDDLFHRRSGVEVARWNGQAQRHG